ncbi:ROK family glucokinase [Anaerotignum sp.]
MFERITEETFDEIFPLLEAAFPVTELRIREEQKKLLRETCYRLYGVRKNGMFAAVFAAWEIDDFLYIEHFAVKEEYRNGGYGGSLLDLFLEEKGKAMVLEVEVPEDEMTERRVGFYERHGLVYNEYPYLQPPMRKGQDLLPLRFMTKPAAIEEKTYERYKKRIYEVVYKYKSEEEEALNMKYCFGIDIGGTTVKIGLVAENGEIVTRWEVPTRKGSDPTGLLEDVKASLEACMAERKIGQADILGIGMAAPGPVTADGVLHGCVNIGWGDVDLDDLAEEVIGISPVRLGNDARVAALGEAAYGAGKGAKSMLMLTLGTGVGGGVVLDGHILMGSSGVAGEIGHMTIDPYETETCGCGKTGCLEQYASATGMVRAAEKFLQEKTDDSVLRQLKQVTAKDLWDAAKDGDKLANEITDFVCDRLGAAIANATYLVDTETVVIGGGVCAAGKFLLDKIENAYNAKVFAHSRNKRFALAELGNDAGIRGAAALILQDAE